MLIKLKKTFYQFITLLFIFINNQSCAPQANNVLDESRETGLKIEVNSQDRSAMTFTGYVTVSDCTSNETYGSSVSSPVTLSSLQLMPNDQCSFTFQYIILNDTDIYYGISGSNTLSASTVNSLLLFSSTPNGSMSLQVGAQVSGLFPVSKNPSISMIVFTTGAVSETAGDTTGEFATTTNTSTNTNLGFSTLSLTSPPYSLGIGLSSTFAAVVTMADGTTATNPSITWSSSNTSAATIDSSTGVATGVATGTTTITASINDNMGNTYSDSYVLSVRNPILIAALASNGQMAGSPISVGANSVSSLLMTTSVPARLGRGLFNVYQTVKAGNTLYAADGGIGKIYSCPLINLDGSISADTGCSSVLTLSGARGIAIVGNYAFVTNGTNVYGCNFTTDSITNCNTTGSNFSTPNSLGTDSTNSLLYVANLGNNTVTVCSISGATLSTCTQSSTGIFTQPFGFAAMNNGTEYIYVSNYVSSNAITYCTVSGTSLSSCTTPNSLGVAYGQGIVVSGNYLYVSEYTNHDVKYCKLSSGIIINQACTAVFSFSSSYSSSGFRGLILN